MTEYLVLATCWLLLSLPVSVILGKCISVGQAGETERHAATTQDAVPARQPTFAADAPIPALPAQRQPTVSSHLSR